MSAKTKTKCSHRLPFGLKWAGRGCQHSSVENLPRGAFLASVHRVRCADCNDVQGILCPDCGRVY